MRTLLLADGSITIQRVIELTFAHEDVRVMSVGDGRRAMQMLESEQPDVVLVDVDLPEMDGYSLAAHIRRVPRLKDVPVLLLAGAFEPVDQDRAREVKSDGVIIKPFEPQVVVTRVKELIDQRDRMATPQPKAAEAPPPEPPSPARTAPEPPAPAPRAARPEPAFMRVAPRDEADNANDAPALETLELPTRPLWAAAPAAPGPLDFPVHAPAPAVAAAPSLPPVQAVIPPAPAAAPPAPKVTLASAFTALLAAEQSAQPAQPAAPAMSEASIEDAVRRVLVRMTDDLVRRIVLDTAERLIREEIERIKATPD
ncbi:MAG TPA: response regulator [Vicinamibacterales bacterium]|nr:response regulator [Vicinamibacterales bacterium]